MCSEFAAIGYQLAAIEALCELRQPTPGEKNSARRNVHAFARIDRLWDKNWIGINSCQFKD